VREAKRNNTKNPAIMVVQVDLNEPKDLFI
jgi:hypothetical protein